MSGTTRPFMLFLLMDLIVTFCHCGRGKTVLTPPPVAPLWPLPVRRPGDCHQTCSVTFGGVPVSIVPPTARANGLELGKSTCALPSVNSSPDPSSPADTHVVIPTTAAIF